MMPSSPRTAQYDRLEHGSGNHNGGGIFNSTRASARRIGWPRIALGAVVLLGLIYMLAPASDYDVDTTWSPADPLDPLSPPNEPNHPASSSKLKSPTSYELDPNPSGTVHCTVPHTGASRLVQYALMIDAGSTGSRIHVYKFHNCDSSPTFEYETFKQTQPGLSNYKSDPEAAAKSLDVLLDEAVRVVPGELHKCTPVAVKATAGLRLTGPEQSEAILAAVQKRLSTKYLFPIHGGRKGVAIMDGAEEGVYAWVTANYLLGAIGGSSSSSSSHAAGSHAVLDLGGASTQIVFEPAFTKDDALEEGEHKYVLNFSGTNHTLYQHSYLGYGLMKARSHVHQLVEFMASVRLGDAKKSGSSDTDAVITNPCLAKGTRKEVKIVDPRDEKHEWSVTMSGSSIGSFEACSKVVELVMAKDAVCAVKPCSFNGVYQPNLLETFPAGKVLLLSYFYDRLAPLHRDISGLSVNTVAKDAQAVCAGESAWKERWGNADTKLMEELKGRPEWCLDLTFMYALLRIGYEFGAERQVTIAKQIEGTEMGWCLGATLAMVAGELTCKA